MKIALAQLGAGEDKQENLRMIGASVERAARERAQLVVFPEYAMYEKKIVDSSFAEAAEPLSGPFCSALSLLAAEHRVAIIAGVVESNPDSGRPFNTLVAFSKTGERVAAYRKIHLFDSYGFKESDSISPATDLSATVVELAGVRIGLMTCYDLRFPEQGRVLVDADAELIVASSSWVPGPNKAMQWKVLAQARAIENGCFVAAVSQSAPISIGSSILVDPMGGVMAEMGAETDFVTVSIDLEDVKVARQKDQSLLHRRYAVIPRDQTGRALS